jgi:NitT/TauT family transport system substrate-binding protein
MPMHASTVRLIGAGDGAYYSPQIIADQLGFFRDEGIELAWDGGSDRAGLSQAMEAGRADLVLGGIWRPMSRMLAGQPMTVFGQVNEQCDLMLFARVPRDEFDWAALGRGTLVHVTGGAPSSWFALRHLMRLRGVDLDRINLIPQLPVDEAIAMFKDGFGNVLEVGDLDASAVLLDEDLHELAYWPEDLGSIPWSVYYGTAERVTQRRSECVALMRALHRAQRWMSGRESGELAELVCRHFPGAATEQVLAVVAAYRRQRLWCAEPSINRSALGRWTAILVAAGWLRRPVDACELVDDEIPYEAMQNVQ